MPFDDLRDYLCALERQGLLHHVPVPVDKDWEVSAVCRRAFQRISALDRPALMFDHVLGFDVPIVTGIVGASRRVYAAALETSLDGIEDCWERALSHPIAPEWVRTAAVLETQEAGEAVDVGRIPVPVWTVGEDPGPYMTAPFVITRDPDTGWVNVGTYRVQVKGPRTVGICSGAGHHGYQHIQKYAQRGEPCPIAVVLGADPAIALVAVTNVPASTDELAVAGGLRGVPVPVTRGRIVDLPIPAGAEYVLEGFVDPQHREPEGPFGEYTGYMSVVEPNYVMQVASVSHRTHPIYQAFFSQMPPSESSLIKKVGRERPLGHYLERQCGLPVTGVCLRESGSSAAWIVIALKKGHPDEPRRAIEAAWECEPTLGKFVVVVDDDIDPQDDFMVDWAISFRCQPGRDTFVHDSAPAVRLDPSVEGFGAPTYSKYKVRGAKMGIDATMKHPYPAKAMPPREHLAAVDRRWPEYGF